MEGHKRWLSLLLVALGRTSAQSCWQCMGSGSTLEACAVPGNGTAQVPVPASIYTTQGVMPICSQRVVFDISACPPGQGCQPGQAELVEVTRGLPLLELEAQMYKTGGMASNVTGTVCTANGVLFTCTNLCEGDLCNSDSFASDLESYTETLTTECLSCNAVTGNSDFQACLDGTVNVTRPCAGNARYVGDDYLNMCVTIVNYDNVTMAPLTIFRGCGIPDFNLYPTNDVQYSTMGQCDTNTMIAGPSGQTQPTISCVKGYIQDISDESGAIVAGQNMAAPGPNATCLQCSAIVGDMSFSACLNPNSTNLEASGVSETVCGCGTSQCMSATMYNSNGTIIGVQRGCGAAPGSESQAQCAYTDTSDVDTSNVVCTSACTAGSTPCNNYNNMYSPDETPVSSSVFVSVSAMLVMTSLLSWLM